MSPAKWFVNRKGSALTTPTDKIHTSTDHSELLNGKRPDIDARMIRDIMQARTEHEITVVSIAPIRATNIHNKADLRSSIGDAA